MADAAELITEGFTSSDVVVQKLNIDHPDPSGRGPFCRLSVTATPPSTPGVYAWVADDHVQYVGEAGQLLHIVHGARAQLHRAYNDYTYVPRSQVLRRSDPRVRINGLLNTALAAGQVITWWWRPTDTKDAAKRLERILIDRWDPPWNRT